MKLLGRLLWKLIRTVILLGVFAAAALLLWAVLTAPKLDQEDVSPDGYRTTVLDMDGEEILTLAGEASNRVYVTLDQIPEDLQHAFVAIEDERFYSHHGIDPKSIARALWRDITAGRMEGASTITQQLLKNNVFTDWVNERGIPDKVRRKVQEQYLALRLEWRLEQQMGRQEAKNWILENYLNTINLGAGAWGVETAAMRYFGKEVSDLTLSECAVLAAIPKSPTGYNPLKNPENSRSRQVLVLRQMLEQGYITQEEYDAAWADDVYARISANNVERKEDIFSYFEDALVYEILDDLMEQFGYSEEDAWRAIYRGGLTICSTQDTRLQTICEEEVNRDSWYVSDAQATVVLMDPETGAVRAIVGGRGEKTGSLTFNRATSQPRQPGSTIKIVGEYAAAIENGQTLAQVYDDAPYSYSNGTAIRNASGTFGGMTTIRKAITNSINVVALKCFQEAGLDSVWDMLGNFGLEHLTDADRVEALALGGTSNGVTNLEMTAAYSAIANGGTYLKPHYYTQILNREGKVLMEKTVEQHRVVSAGTAALLTEAMKDVMTQGTGRTANFSGMTLAGKSGTSSNLRDLWFVGYSPYYVCGVWGGYDDHSGQSSSAYVKNIWKAVMQQTHAGLQNRDFDYDVTLETETICTKCGNLAVEGLCSDTVQGNMTATEIFLPGTAPQENCTCHVEERVCVDSGEKAGMYCPHTESHAYLISGSEGTTDAAAVLPVSENEKGTCQMHQRWWSHWFPDDDDSSYDPDDSIEPKPYDPETPHPQRPPVPNWREWIGNWRLSW